MSNWFQIPLSFAIRYLFPGLVIYIYYHLYAIVNDCEMLETCTVLHELLLFELVGFFFYLIYRPLIYNPFIPRIQDFFCVHSKSDNYRTYLRNRYESQYDIKTVEAQFIYHEIKRSIERYSEEQKIPASCIHLLYMAGILGIITGIVTIIGNFCMGISIFIAGLILLIAGFFSDRYYERIELGIVKRLHPSKLDTIAKSLLVKKAQT